MSRREKDLMRRFEAAEISFYAPACAAAKMLAGGDGLVRSFCRFSPSYVFLNGDDEKPRSVRTHHELRCRWLPIQMPRRFVFDLRRIRQLIDAEAPLTPEARLEPGRPPCRVAAGSLVGLEGTIVKRHGQRRLLVAVEFLQQGASVQIDDCAVGGSTDIWRDFVRGDEN